VGHLADAVAVPVEEAFVQVERRDLCRRPLARLAPADELDPALDPGVEQGV
jgi:hypothetical protein